MVLAGDIGGTNTRLAFFDGNSGVLEPLATEVFPSGEHAGLGEIAEAFIDKHQHSISNACFGIAGPVRNGICQTPNLPWVIKATELAKQLEVKSVRLLNDLEANAYGIAELRPQDFVSL